MKKLPTPVWLALWREVEGNIEKIKKYIKICEERKEIGKYRDVILSMKNDTEEVIKFLKAHDVSVESFEKEINSIKLPDE
mgnify:CR=1 FL=1